MIKTILLSGFIAAYIWWACIQALKDLAPQRFEVTKQYTASLILVHVFAPVILAASGFLALYDEVNSWLNTK
jgi:hypothetical protein